MNGIAMKVEKMGFKSAKKIMEDHITQAKKSGKVYFSTDVGIAEKFLRQIEVVFFYNVKEDMFYIGNVVRIEKRKIKGNRSTMDNAFIPEDSDMFSVLEYANEPRKTWILLENIRVIDKSKFSEWKTISDNITVAEKILQVGRYPRFYFVG
ncbi:MAG: hypothetical protein J6A25_10915 [Lachnospiraceae bacterium]|nr:hypothetical protein [Lachnospiraceae bacterium]